MTTKSSQTARVLAEGEPATDLIEALDALLAKTRRERTPLDRFYEELHGIYVEVCRRIGEPEPTQRLGSVEVQQAPEFIDDGSPEEDAFDIWTVVRIMAENKVRGPYLSNDEVWAEFEDELGPYDPDEPVDFDGDRASSSA